MYTAIISFFISAAVLNAAGGEPFAFLKLGMGTRATGMGCAFTSIADDASAAYYNPAGTVNLKGLELMGETYFLSFGRSVNYVATAKPFILNGGTYAVGASWINNSSGEDIEVRLTNSTEADSRISDSTHIFLFNVASRFSDNISLGGNFKFLFETLGTNRATGVGFDLGGMVNIADNLNFGLSFTGISTNVTWNSSTHSETIPQVINAGLSYKYVNMFGAAGFSILPAVDLVYNSFSGFKVRAGAEFSLNDFLFIRGGYNNALCLGAGIRLKPSQIFSVKMDYAFVADNAEPGAANHRLGAVIVYVFPETGVIHKNGPDLKQTQNSNDGQKKPEGQIKKNERTEDYDW